MNPDLTPNVCLDTKSLPTCGGCQKGIRERYLLKALDQFWHEACLKCTCCNCRLGEVGSSLFTKANLILCKRDYLRLFGTTGLCSACNKTIPAFEMVMKAGSNVYHLDCFVCQCCNHSTKLLNGQSVIFPPGGKESRNLPLTYRQNISTSRYSRKFNQVSCCNF
ncbi:LIM domain only protein 3-like isoform X2 [Tachypleus tridentatus]|uniref:LIM domain only protein 3-like isoform X2 n=1 Tax=Tachypleus tridentatus TaxID=6853 RepID=UPI003FD65861